MISRAISCPGAVDKCTTAARAGFFQAHIYFPTDTLLPPPSPFSPGYDDTGLNIDNGKRSRTLQGILTPN